MKKATPGIQRRDFLKILGIGTAITASWAYMGDSVFAQIPFEEERLPYFLDNEDSDYQLDEGTGLGKGTTNWAPRIALDAANMPWVTWVSRRDGVDRILLTSFDGTSFGEEIVLSAEGVIAGQPAIVSAGDSVAVAWVEDTADGWKIQFQWFKGGVAQGNVLTIGDWKGLVNWHPALAAASDGTVWITWEQKQPDGPFKIRARQISGQNLSVGVEVSPTEAGDCLRPSVAVDKKGKVWFAWDQEMSAGCKAVYIRSFEWSKDAFGRQLVEQESVAKLQSPVRVSWHPALNVAPALAVDDENQLWIAWHSNRKDNDQWDIPRWIYLRCYKDGKLYQTASPQAYMDLTKEGTDQGFEFPRLVCAPDGKVIITGRPSQNFCLQFYQGDQWSKLYRLPKDGWGGRGKHLDAVMDNTGALWVVRRDLGKNLLQKISAVSNGKAVKTKLIACTEEKTAAPALVNLPKKHSWDPIVEAEGIPASLYTYYGNIHGHTWMSDGTGDVDEYYINHRDCCGDDFCALSDHDSFVGRTINQNEWEMQKEWAQHFNNPGQFITLFAQEWTTARYPKGAGHKNIYSLDPEVPLFDHLQKEYRTSKDIYPLLRQYGCIAIPHHVGWTGTDWDMCDRDITPVVEIISNHGAFEYEGNEPIPHRGNIPGHFAQDGLALGKRFGFIGGSDTHGLIWHHRAGWTRNNLRSGLACVLAPELTRESIFEAIQKRHTFATTGVKCRLDFRVNNYIMGDEFTTNESKVQIKAQVDSPQDIKWVTVVKNNKDLYKAGAAGYTPKLTINDPEVDEGENWYYLRVEFENGEMAWSSPVWVTRKV
jgi:uncharacterized protein DUF3604